MTIAFLTFLLLFWHCQCKPDDISVGGREDADADQDSYYQRRCMRGYAASNFHALDTDNYEQWFHENSTLTLAETGVYTGIDGIAEYVGGPGYYMEGVDLNPKVLPLSFNETMCVALFTVKLKATTDPAIVGEEPVGLETIIAYTLYWTVAGTDAVANDEYDQIYFNSTNISPTKRFNNFDGNYNFKIHKFQLYFSNAFLRRLYGVELETPAVGNFVCDVMMSPGCEETRMLNQLNSHEECMEVYNNLLSTNTTGKMDDKTKGCRILHAACALKNPKHCPHISFEPQEDYKGVIKCQTSSGLVASDLFSETELNFIRQESINYGFDGEKQYAESDPVPSISTGVKAFPSKPPGDDNEINNGSLRLLLFDPLIPCADGSPSGIYIEENPKVQSSQNHVLVFYGGAACTDPQDCEKAYRMEPFKFSTNFNPSTLKGTTVLSRDPVINPIMHNYTKWLVPYCSQDFFLGDIKKGKVGNFTHGGSIIFDAALKFWQSQVHPKTSSKIIESREYVQLDNVVVVGLSAGAIGVMNKVNEIRNTANSEENLIRTRNLKIVLDSPSVLSDLSYVEKNLKNAMLNYVNLEENPLCHPLHPFTRAFERMSALPCCLSIHCMLRHDKRLSSFYDPYRTPEMDAFSANSSNNAEDLLVLDSAYDPFALVASVDLSSSGKASITSSDLFAQLEIGGLRKTRGVETAAIAKLMTNEKKMQDATLEEFHDQPRVKWIFGSCFQHTYLVPAPALLEMSCLYGNYEEVSYGYDCRDDGHSFVIKMDDYSFGVWRTTDTWNEAFFRDESMHVIIDNFIGGNFSDQLPSPVVLEGGAALLSYDSTDAIDFRLESCIGPNCRDNTQSSTATPSCQTMIETKNYFGSIPTGFVLFWVVMLLLLLVAAPGLRTSCTKTSMKRLSSFTSGKEVFDVDESKDISISCKSPEEVTPFGATKVGINESPKGHHTLTSVVEESDSPLTIRGINVVSADGKNIVSDVNLSLAYGTLNALCGRSGSGKTSILRALSSLHHPGVEITIGNGSLDLERMPRAFLRQHDDSESFGKLIPANYLRYTAQILDCDKQTTADVLLFASQLFQCRKTSEDPENHFDPFISTTIENLSGGQRRFLNIAVALLSKPKLLLLDEPLSGLDSASSLFVLKGLQAIAERDKCAICMSVHQPSENVLEYYDKVFLMEGGRMIFQKSIALEGAHKIHTELEQRIVSGSSSNEPISQSEDEYEFEEEYQSSREIDSVTTPSDIDTLDRNHMDKGSCESEIWKLAKTLKQIPPLARRLQPQFGWEPWSGLALVIILIVIAYILLFETFYPQRVTLLFLCLLGIPGVVFPHTVVEHAVMWKAHQQELEDKKITPLAFQLTTVLYTFPIPVFSLLLGQIFTYLIQGWAFDSFMYQWVISCVHLFCSLQLGRTIMVGCRGEFNVGIRVYAVCLVFCFVFNGVWVSYNEAPIHMKWTYFLSINFWGVSGAVMRQYQDDVYSNAGYCDDLVTCLYTDANTIVRNLGFAPLSNTRLALGVLTGMFIVLFLLELILLRRQSAGKRLEIRKLCGSS